MDPHLDSLEKASEYMRIVLQLLGKHNIPVTPPNYAIWYNYVAGKNKKLNKAIDEIVKEKKTFTGEINQYLYLTYVDEDTGMIEKVRSDIKMILSELLQQISSTEGEFTNYEEALHTYSKRLETTEDAKGIQTIIEYILAQTKAMEDSGRSLKKRLEKRAKEVETLRKNLEEVKKEANIDPLTGIANRRLFDKTLAEEMANAQESKLFLSLVILDIDHFKRVNDTYGHLVGDSVLKVIAGILKNHVKGQDTVARFGGEEFAIILPETPIHGAFSVADKIRSAVEKSRLTKKTTGELLGNVTISAGISLYRNSESVNFFIQRADAALYRSKENGRNKVTREDM